MSYESDCAIVGGGAAGLATAIFTARRNPQWRVRIVDGAKRLGAKILIAGGGRCNVTNDIVTPGDFCGGSRNIIRRVLQAFPVEHTVSFFKEIGVPLHVEPGGKLFPDTNRARTVLDALTREADRLGVQIFCNRRVLAAAREAGGFTVTAENGDPISARYLVLATGGMSVPKTGSDGHGYRLAQSLGHTLVPQTPALVALCLAGDFHSKLSGVSQPVELTVTLGGEKPFRVAGSLLWTHFGLSGPAVLDASRHWHRAQLEGRSVHLTVNLLAGSDYESADRRLLDLAADRPRGSLQNRVAELVPARVASAILDRLGLDHDQPIGQLSRVDRRRLVQELVALPLAVTGSRGFPFAEATAGGVPLHEIDPGTMASRRCAGLFLAGEILDVDGRIGGFNFQWAWSSAWVAAHGLTRAGA